MHRLCPQVRLPLTLLGLLLMFFHPRLAAAPRTNWVVAFPTPLTGSAGKFGLKSLPVGALYGSQDRVLAVRPEGLTCYDGELWGSSAPFSIFDSPAFITVDGKLLGVDGFSGRISALENNRTWALQPGQMQGSTHRWSTVAFGNGIYVAASAESGGGFDGLDTSTNLLNWTAASFFSYPGSAGLVFAGDHFVLLTPENGAWHSTDGRHWQWHPVDPLPGGTGEASRWLGLRQLNGVLMALGQPLSGSTNGVIATSHDGGTTWSVQKPAGTIGFTDAAYANGQYVAVGTGVVGHSADAEHWTFDFDVTRFRLVGVSHVNGRFVAVSAPGISYTSADGLHWTSPQHGGYPLNAVSATTDGFVAVGGHGTILTSANGTDWRQEVSGTTEDLYGVGTGGGLTLATGDHGTVLTSLDTRAWTLRHTQTRGPTYTLRGVAYARGRYVVAGAYLTSTDGIDWQITPGYQGTPANYARAIVDDGQQFLFLNGASPDAPYGWPNRVARSPDGLT